MSILSCCFFRRSLSRFFNPRFFALSACALPARLLRFRFGICNQRDKPSRQAQRRTPIDLLAGAQTPAPAKKKKRAFDRSLSQNSRRASRRLLELSSRPRRLSGALPRRESGPGRGRDTKRQTYREPGVSQASCEQKPERGARVPKRGGKLAVVVCFKEKRECERARASKKGKKGSTENFTLSSTEGKKKANAKPKITHTPAH